MDLADLPLRIDKAPDFERLALSLESGIANAQIDGLVGVAKSLAIARMFQRRQSPTLIITYQFEQAQRLIDDLRNFGIPEDQLFILPGVQHAFLQKGDLDYRSIGERIAALTALATGPCLVVGTPEAALQFTSPADVLTGAAFTVCPGEEWLIDDLCRKLVQIGYESETTVGRPGQFSRRGGILDIFVSAETHPVRLDFFGDEIETIKTFDVSTQRSTEKISRILITPAREVVLDPERTEAAADRILEDLKERKIDFLQSKARESLNTLHERVEDDMTRLRNGVYFDSLEDYIGYVEEDAVTALEYLYREYNGRPGMLIVDEPGLVRSHAERHTTEFADARKRRWERGETLVSDINGQTIQDALKSVSGKLPCLVLNQLPRVDEALVPHERMSFSASTVDSFRHRLHELTVEARTWKSNGATCLLITDQPQRVKEICRELDLAIGSPGEPGDPEALVLEGRLRQGFKLAEAGLFVVTDAELFGSSRPIIARKRADVGIPISTVLDLRENDYVVHVHHGIGVYRGLTKRVVEGAERDYLLIQYAGGDKLYVPADQIDRIQRYVGAEGAPPTIHRIGGNEWAKATKKVKEQAQRMAGELIQLYAARLKAERPSFGEDTPWQTEMEDAFPYDETRGQLKAIEDVKADLIDTRPMDRLICGDVGFGKTEVAIRAAFKVLEAGKQVAVLCPTTVLAAQHHQTFTERLAAYPLNVGLLSRFRTKPEQKKTVDALKSGEVEICVGTHRLLSKDITFKNLGLVIVDEEQRFGVAHKERLKQLRTSVDVLTLSATPIPRTLSMALSGLRDMSVIDDPPSGRVPIVTYVREYDDEVIRDAILRELERDGQAYFVHNRIETIYQVARRIQKLAPDARICVGHGQMSEDELEEIMHGFYAHEYDILVCTTIIENGLDVPNVNTIIVDNADKMGLSQLYQLRGRVGRSNRQAFAHLLYRRDRVLSEDAERRLVAIREFTALGSGYQVAMRDLEIRGAGNLLGSEQSGAMLSVGFDLYCQLLQQAVAELKGEEPEELGLPPVDLPITVNIPPDYIPNEAERIFFYKRMSSTKTMEDIETLKEEFIDRYGDPPRQVWNALSVLELRVKAHAAGIASVRAERKDVHIRFTSRARLTPQSVRLLTYMYKNHRFMADSVVFGLVSSNVMEEVEGIIDVLARALAEGENVKKDTVGAR
jgi:transcription-repair coupling factor (superfamily II helicase)